MNLLPILPYAKKLLQDVIRPGDSVVDATVGNGHDTLFLSELVGQNGRVFGFDIQSEAIETTRQRLTERAVTAQVLLHLGSHADVQTVIPEQFHGSIKAAIFNLGYLPGSDKHVVTQADSTIAAINGILAILTVGGLIVLVVYHGHEGGKQEKDAVTAYLADLDQKKAQVLRYQFINQKNDPPFVIAIEKLHDNL